MELSDRFLDPSSRRRKIKGLQQTPLDVRHDSHSIIKKQSPAPAPRQPVIIYTVSPEVIHVDRSEFMSLVQRLTGAPSSSSDDNNSVLSTPSSFSDPRCGRVARPTGDGRCDEDGGSSRRLSLVAYSGALPGDAAPCESFQCKDF